MARLESPAHSGQEEVIWVLKGILGYCSLGGVWVYDKNNRWFTSLCPILLSFRRLVHTGSRGSDGSHEGPAGQPVLPEGGGSLGPDGGIACQENHCRPVPSQRAKRREGRGKTYHLGVFFGGGKGQVFLVYCKSTFVFHFLTLERVFAISRDTTAVP